MTLAAFSPLPVSAPVREATRRAVIALALTAVLFTVFAFVAKEGSAVRAAVPWQDDPYDVVVSFTMFFVPLATGLMLMRVPLCRRFAPLPMARLAGIQRAGNVLLVAVGATEAAEWLAVLAGGARSSWTSATPIAIAGLAGVSAVTLVAGTLQLRAVRGQSTRVVSELGPDWLDDGRLLLESAAAWVHPRLAGLVRWAGGSLIDGRLGIRRHPGFAVTFVAIVFSLTLAVSEVRSQGGGSTSLSFILLFATIGAAGMAAFLLVSARYLHLLRREPSSPPGRRIMPIVVTVGTASVPVTVAFRDQLAVISGGAISIHSTGDLLALIIAVAILASCLTALGLSVAQRRVTTAPKHE